MTSGQHITDEEAAILRAWLGGHMLTDIAKARRVEHADVARVIVDTCGTNRAVAREWLNGGPRPEANVRTTRPGPKPAFREFVDPPSSSPPAPVRPDEAEIRESRIDKPAPEPLARWNIHRCPDCSYLGPAGEHAADCAGQLQPVVLLLLPRTEET